VPLDTVILYPGIYFVFLCIFQGNIVNTVSRYIILNFSWYLKHACILCHVLHSCISPMKE